MKLFILNNYPGPGLGGGETQLLALVRGCIAAGVSVSVVSQVGSPLADEVRALGATAHEIDFSPVRLPKAISEVCALLCEAGVSVVQGTGFLTNIVARRASVGTQSRVLNVVHVESGASVLDGGSRLGLSARRVADRFTRGRVDRFIAVSEAVARSLVADGVRDDLIDVVHNGIDIEQLSEPGKRDTAAESSPSSGPRIGYLGRLEPVKGPEYFVRMAKTVLQDAPHACFLLAGSGALESRLRVLAAAEMVQDRFEFLGQVDPVVSFLKSIDVLVVPSLSEGLPMAVLEAGALGKPVVATAVGGLPEVVEDGVTGLLVPARDPEALAGGVLELLNDPGRAARMGAAARERVTGRFTVERMVKEYLAVYRDLLSDS